MKALIIILSILIIGCSPSKRINRIVKNNPQLLVKDTIYVNDTVIIETVIHDTTTVLVNNKTVEVVNNEKVRLQYKYDTITNEINHYVECKGDTVRRTIRVPYNKIQPVTVEKRLNGFIWGVVVALLIFIIGFIIKLKN